MLEPSQWRLGRVPHRQKPATPLQWKLHAFHLNPDQDHRIAEALRTGAYHSADDVIDRALEVLHEHDEWLAGIEELERGEAIPEEQLDDYLAKRLRPTQPVTKKEEAE